MGLKARSDMDINYQWDLSQIYDSQESWEEAYAKAALSVKKISEIKGSLGDSAQELKRGLDIVYDASELVERVYLYAMLAKAGDNGDAVSQEREGRAMSLMVAHSTSVSFLEPEILAIEPEKLSGFMKDPSLSIYLHNIENIARWREHTLDEQGERMLAMLGDVSEGFSNSYEMFTSVDLTFPTVKNEKGEEVQLTHGNFGVFRESADRRVRFDAFRKFLMEYKRYINTFAAMYSGQVKLDCYYSDVRGFGSACEASLFSTNVPVSVYDSLCEAVRGALPTMRRYIELRKRVLSLQDLSMFDMYVPMTEDVDISYTYEQSKELVKQSLMPLGERYQCLLDMSYNERWIDVYENKGKTTGAFSCGVYGAHPYVLLNYTDTLDDAFTLAHELGHAMHSYLSSEKQVYANHNYTITVAEVASTVNEVLLTMHLLKTETDKKRRAYILYHFLEGFRTTVFRQTLFAEFERRAHDMYMAGVPLTARALSEVYRELETTYYDGAVVDELMDVEWSYIPHFYRNFYVYQYATGFCCAVTIAKNILEGGGADNYLEFLSTGGSDYPIEELKLVGVDLTKPDTVKTAMEVFADTLTELEKLLEPQDIT